MKKIPFFCVVFVLAVMAGCSGGSSAKSDAGHDATVNMDVPVSQDAANELADTSNNKDVSRSDQSDIQADNTDVPVVNDDGATDFVDSADVAADSYETKQDITTDTSDSGDIAVPPVAVLRIWPMDIWAGRLRDYNIKMTASDGTLVPLEYGFPIYVKLMSAGKYTIELSADNYDTEKVDVWVDAQDQASAVYAKRQAGMEHQGLSVSHRNTDRAQGPNWVHSIWLGLRSHYFAASGRPPRYGNKVALLMDGEEAWSRVKDELDAATDNILLSTWWWQSAFELYRPAGTHVYMTEEQRRKNTIFYILTHSPAYKRVLVGQFWSQDGFLDWMNTDKDLKTVAEDDTDDFEFMGQANPSEGKFEVAIPGVDFASRIKKRVPDSIYDTFDAEDEVPSDIKSHEADMTDFPTGLTLSIASYHQKFIAIDNKTAFVGGMNVKSTDWDTHKHAVFEPRRMEFDSSTSDREDVAAKKSDPDLGPRKDYMVFLRGPVVRDVVDLFHKRWKYLLGQGVEYSKNSSDFSLPDKIQSQPEDVEVQLTATLPDPLNENAIWESQVNAVRHANHFIYIEDQYFRAPLLFNAIVDRMLEKPKIKLIVVTKPVNEWTDPGCRWTYEANILFKDAVGDRYLPVQLRSFDTHVTLGIDETDAEFRDMDVHSKMLIVDDVYMNVGSCNKNNRGLLYEGEANVSILNRKFVQQAIKRIFSNLLDQEVDTTDPDQLMTLVKNEADANQDVWDRWDAEGFDLNLGDGTEPLPDAYKPVGFVYPLPFNPVKKCLIESIGPDVMMPYKGD